MDIPPVLHQIWLGPAVRPDRHKRWTATWLRHHPHWSHKLWRDSVRDELPAVLRQCYDKAHAWAHKADIARYWIIAQHGGIYADTDFECLRPVEELIADCSMFACEASRTGRVTNALFGAVPGHPAMQAVTQMIPTAFSRNILSTGPRFFDRIVRARDDVCVLPQRHFYEYTWSAAARNAPPEVGPQAYGIHYFEVSWRRNSGRKLPAT